MVYRREIDGLRALAVLPVILFHAGFTIFSGGFVGVDVFFVISGYLITSIILTEKHAGTFSLVNFYERRARRILPALFFVMMVCVCFSWFMLSPSDMKEFSKSVRNVSIFMSNIFFYKQSGYFDTAAELKPLLHTWSLAIEEQYYLFFPILMLALWKVSRKLIPYFLLAITVISLVYTQYKVGVDANAAYFLLPSRLWELMIGSLLAYLVVNKHVNVKGNQLASLVGLILILYAILFFNSFTPFPSIYALVPTIGAVLIITYATPDTLVGKLLGNKLFVGIGLISFSAYLWHQPLFAFARHSSISEPSSALLAALAILALVLAYFSWRFVETPFRNKKNFNRKQIFQLSALLSSLFLAFGITGKLTNGFESRLPDELLAVMSFKNYNISAYRPSVCFLYPQQSYKEFKEVCGGSGNAQSALIWGDSHAAALSLGLRNEMVNVIQYTTSGCPPIKDAEVNKRPRCKEVNNYVMSKIKTLKPQYIFLHANWKLYDAQNPIKNIKKTISYVRSVSRDSEIIIIGAVPEWKPSLPDLMVNKKLILNDVQYLKNSNLADLKVFDSEFRKVAKEENVKFFSAINAFCQNANCQITTPHNKKIVPVAWDDGHLTKGGSTFLAKRLLEKLDTL